MNISKQIKKYRKEFNVSQEALAEELNVSRQTISNWENDKGYPDLQNLIMLSDYFKVSLDELVKGDVVKLKTVVNKKSEIKNEKTTARKYIDYLTNLEEALKDGRVSCTIKIGNNFFPSSNFPTMSNCLCEFTEEEVKIISCKTSVLFWKRTTKLVKKIYYNEIDSVNFSIDRRFSTVFGGFPSYNTLLHLDILLKNNELILFECGSFEEIKELLRIFNKNKVKVIDEVNFNKLYEENTTEEVKEYLHSNYEKFI